ncbi:MAG: hypothetical protein GC149_14755, partial [Gammaproteobacteria bacterium]|nr:hypothetical protein [Gammaproteobacteria bacterium]
GNAGTVYLYVDNTLYTYKSFTTTSAPFDYNAWLNTTLDAGHLSQGTHTFKVIATSVSGVSVTKSVSITVDNTPHVTISSPADGVPVEGAFDFTGTATFKPVASGNAGTVYLYVDNTLYTYKSFTTTSAPFDYNAWLNTTLDAKNFTQGAHTFKVTATSANGTSVSDQHTIIIAKYIVDPDGIEEQSGCSKTHAGNPCNPLTGNKFEVEMDRSASGIQGLSFARFYNSNSNVTWRVGNKWSHSYDYHLYTEHKYIVRQLTANSSAQYTTRKDACETGWQDIKGRVVKFETAGTTARWEGESCNIYSASNARMGRIKAYTYVPNVAPYDTGDVVAMWVTMPNGTRYRFTSTASGWQTDPGVVVKLETTAEGYRVTDENDQIELYDTTGKITQLMDATGNSLIFTHDTTTGLLSSVENDRGVSLAFAYDGNGHLSSVTDNASRTWEYQYDGNGNLASVTNPDTTVRQYYYEDPLNTTLLTGITDERAVRFATWQYDDQHRVVSSEHAGGVEKISINYTNPSQRILTNSRNANSTYTLMMQDGAYLPMSFTGPGCVTCNATNTTFEYDAANRVTKSTKDGLATVFGGYDANNNPGYKIEGFGTALERRSDYTYDTNFIHKVKTITEPSVCSGHNKITDYTYDAGGNLTQVTVAGYTPSCTAVSRTTTLQYNGPLSQLSQIDGPRTDISDITTLDYYPNDPSQGNNRGRLVRVTLANGIVARDNIQYTATGKIQSESRPNGLTLSYTYYPGNDRLETLTQSAAGLNRVTHWTYLPTGEVETITQGYGSSSATTLTFGYDDARRLTRITDAQGNYIEYQLDTEDNKVQENRYDANGVLQRQLVQAFDLYNRLDTSTQANEIQNPDFAPDGTLSKTTDGKNVQTQYGYDDLKRLITRTADVGGTDPSTQDALTKYGYNIHDQLTSVTDPINGETQYEYDDLGNLLTQTSPDTGTTTFTYDAAGNMKTRLDAKGQSFSYSYDALNRLTQLTAPIGAESITYSYDTCTNGEGRLCDITQNGTTVSYGYNAFGDVVGSQGMGYGYDELGRVKTLTYPSGDSVTYSYDASGRIDRVDAVINGSPQTLASNISYAPFGPVTSMTYGNALSYSQALDTAYRPSNMTVPNALTLTNSQYDGNGNLTQRDEASVFTQYGYDALDRIDTTSGAFGTRNYNFDKNGNRSSDVVDNATTTYDYRSATNVMSAINGAAVSVDANGNTTSLRGMTLGYDSLNRLLSINNATYSYNGLNQRVMKTVNGVSTNYMYGLKGELLTEASNDPNGNAEYVYLNGVPLAVIRQGSVYYVHTDQLGAPRSMTDANQVVVWRWDSDPFGVGAANDDPDGDGVTVTMNLRFPGQYYDAESGLYYNYFRYYDPSTGRYITSDPIGLNGGINTYGYVGANPLYGYDPYGLFSITDPTTWPTFDQSTVDFAAGFGDSLSFGLTANIRSGLGIGGVNKCSNAYRYGEYTDLAFEVGTMGLSAGLKGLAARASRNAVRNGARPFVNAFREANGLESGFVHHSNPLFGHPGGFPTTFPTGGLPAWVNSGAWNLRWFPDSASHAAAHQWMRGLENVWGALVNPGTTGIRAARDAADACSCQK